MSEILQARALDVTRGERTVLRDVDFTARAGQVTAIVGPNGAGKSSLLMTLAGMLEPARGEVLFAGRPLSALSGRVRAQSLAYVPQQSLLAAPLTVAEVVEQGRFPHRGPWGRSTADDAAAVAAALARARIEALAERDFRSLSGGEKRRVLLARALAVEAQGLLLDEPSASLEIGHVVTFFGLLRSLADEGKAVVVVLHDLNEVRTHCDVALLLDEGVVVARGTARDVIEPTMVRTVYRADAVEGGALGFGALGFETLETSSAEKANRGGPR
ncbi:MAG: ABC transporter ATP-binding protein [Myxococcota bacterium]